MELDYGTPRICLRCKTMIAPFEKIWYIHTFTDQGVICDDCFKATKDTNPEDTSLFNRNKGGPCSGC